MKNDNGKLEDAEIAALIGAGCWLLGAVASLGIVGFILYRLVMWVVA